MFAVAWPGKRRERVRKVNGWKRESFETRTVSDLLDAVFIRDSQAEEGGRAAL